uniref:Uncharacterized protein n=1 Tax=Glossina pallidipes TaxID=7398 RepID=A0A1B0A1S1_GLOPL
MKYQHTGHRGYKAVSASPTVAFSNYSGIVSSNNRESLLKNRSLFTYWGFAGNNNFSPIIKANALINQSHRKRLGKTCSASLTATTNEILNVFRLPQKRALIESRRKTSNVNQSLGIFLLLAFLAYPASNSRVQEF